MDPAQLDPRLRDTGEDSIVVNAPSDPAQIVAASNEDEASESPPDHFHPGGQSPPPPVGGFAPQTPGNPLPLNDDTPNASGATPQDPNDPKRPRACEACRGLKVKCEPDPANPDGPCKRCAKAGRSCVVTQPTRKRQKKTDSRVAELEKKIDALTASLHATRGGPASQQNPTEDHNGYGTVSYGNAPRDWAPPREPQPQYAPEPEKVSLAPPLVTAGQKRKFAETRDSPCDVTKDPAVAQTTSTGRQHCDVIDRGMITMDDAAGLFQRYTEHMAPHLPAVVFPRNTTAAEVRKTKPILFLAVLSVASSETPKLQRQLVKELMQIFADKIIITGEKSLEMVQALQVSVIWYFPPEHFEELKFYQFIHLAAIISIDIGLGRRKNNPKSRLIPYTWRDHPFRKHPLPDPTTIESRRAWLSSYFLASNVAMALHRPNLIRWQAFMTECIDILESSPDAAPSDRYLCHLVWTHRLAEEVGIQFSMDDPGVFVNITEQKVQYALRGFERDLAKYSEGIPKEDKQPSLLLGFHVLNLYMHEIALYVDKNEDAYRQPTNADALRDPIPGLGDQLTAAHISALSACLTAIDGIFETFLSMETSAIRCLPIFNFVRVAFAVVVLIKMYFSASSPNSELGKVINKDNMKVAEYLEKLLEKFREAAASDKSRPAAKFLVVLVMLRGWFNKQGHGPLRGDGPTDPALASQGNKDSAAPSNKQQNAPSSQQQKSQQPPAPQQQSDFNPANTPLQLLSEIATGNGQNPAHANANANANVNANNQSYQAWMQTSAPLPPSYIYDPTTGATTTTGPEAAVASIPGPGQGVQPWLGSGFGGDMDYTALGDGFEQAMGLTLTGFPGVIPGPGVGVGGGGGGPDDAAASYEESVRMMMQNNDMLSGMLEGFPGGAQNLFQF